MSPPATPENARLRKYIVDIIIIAGLVMAGTSFALGRRGEEGAAVHIVTGTFGLALLVLTAITGAMIRRRIAIVAPGPAYRVHRITSFTFILMTAATFLFGLLTRMQEGRPLLETFHGLLGLIIVALALFQVIPVHILTGRPHLRALHRITGYLILPLFLLQVVLGLGMGEGFEGRD